MAARKTSSGSRPSKTSKSSGSGTGSKIGKRRPRGKSGKFTKKS